MRDKLTTKTVKSLVLECFGLVRSAPGATGQNYMTGSPAYGVLEYRVDEFDVCLRINRFETVARNYQQHGVNGHQALVSVHEIFSSDFLIEYEQIWEINLGNSRSPHWAATSHWNNHGANELSKLEWCGDLDSLVGAITYLRMMHSLKENS